MFNTKKHISRRTVLKGVGVNLALPFLSADGACLDRAGPDRGRAETSRGHLLHSSRRHHVQHQVRPRMGSLDAQRCRRRLQVERNLASLEPYKKYVTSFGNLENAAAAGSVHVRNPATWLSATLPNGNIMATTLDQVMAKFISQDTQFPSLEVSSETTVQVAAGNGGAFTTLSFRDEKSPLPMEYNPRKVFLQLFGEGDTPQERAAMVRQSNSILD